VTGVVDLGGVAPLPVEEQAGNGWRQIAEVTR